MLSGVINLLDRIIHEVIGLARHGAEASHLPEQPFLHLDALTLIGGIELPGFAAQVLKDRAGSKDRNRPSARAIGIDDGWNAVVGRDAEKLRPELLATADV